MLSMRDRGLQRHWFHLGKYSDVLTRFYWLQRCWIEMQSWTVPLQSRQMCFGLPVWHVSKVVSKYMQHHSQCNFDISRIHWWLICSELNACGKSRKPVKPAVFCAAVCSTLSASSYQSRVTCLRHIQFDCAIIINETCDTVNEMEVDSCGGSSCRRVTNDNWPRPRRNSASPRLFYSSMLPRYCTIYHKLTV